MLKMNFLLSSVPCPQAKLLMPTLMALQLLMATAFPVALPGCPESCGGITVPYPFGVGQSCSRPGFNLTCDETRHPPKLFLGDGVEVDAISLADLTVRIQSKVLNATSLGFSNGSWSGGLTPANATIAVSTQHYVFAAIGCNIIAHLVADHRHEYVSACSALCDGWTGLGDASCSGVGCCQTTITQGLPAYGVQFKDLAQTAGFVVDSEWFSRNVGALRNSTFNSGSFFYGAVRKVTSVPTVLEWWLEVERDGDLVVFNQDSGWTCIGLNSFAAGVDVGSRVRCSCSEGYEGNPYIAVLDAKVSSIRHATTAASL